LFLIATSGWSLAEPIERPKLGNCRLKAPPVSAGEIMTSGQFWRVYPRTKDIGPSYRGCQSVWSPDERGGWELVVLFRIEQRVIVEVWPPPPDGESTDHCRYDHGQVTSDSPASCRALHVESVPAGCVARSIKRHLYPKMPEGCKAG
jgi:hypothetical protein